MRLKDLLVPKPSQYLLVVDRATALAPSQEPLRPVLPEELVSTLDVFFKHGLSH